LKCVFADEQPAAVVPNDLHAHRELDAVSFKKSMSKSSIIQFEKI
jgi:hypothetical protein